MRGQTENKCIRIMQNTHLSQIRPISGFCEGCAYTESATRARVTADGADVTGVLNRLRGHFGLTGRDLDAVSTLLYCNGL